MNKVFKLDNIDFLLKQIGGKKIVFTNGCFDIIHNGHIELLKFSRNLGDLLIVGLNTDISVKKIKGEKRPIVSEDERISILLAIRYVDYIVLFDNETPYKIIKKIKPDILVKGGDYKEEEIVGRKFSKKTIVFPTIKDKATSGIIEKIILKYCNKRSNDENY